MNISIAMATYNSERFLQEQLDSLAWQTHLPGELVVGNDGSTDGTMDTLERFAKMAPFPVRIHRNSVNLGVSDNFLVTANRCSGDWIAFCDHDDVWLPKKLERAAAVGKSRPNVDLIIVENIWTDESLVPNRRRRPSRMVSLSGRAWMPRSSPLFVHEGHKMVVRRYLVGLPWQTRPLRHGQKMAHDTYIGLLGYLMRRRVFLNERLVRHRRHNEAASLVHDGALAPRFFPEWDSAEHSKCFFEEQREFWAAMARWCQEASLLVEPNICDRLRRAAQNAEVVGRWCEMRERIYSRDASRWARISALAEIAARGGYLKGFGLPPLAKDLFQSLVGSRWKRTPEVPDCFQ